LVPRRDYGPIITPDTLATGSALSVQYTGWSRTRELDAFMMIDLAKSAAEVKAALQYFDCGSQNFAVADTDGNIAYFTSAELPIREDLQSNTVNGAPPWFIRNGTGGNEWLPAPSPLPEDQAVPHQILPYSEMPQVVNPVAGWFANGNNDPIGTSLGNNPLGMQRPGGGIFYLDVGYGYASFRGGRIAQLIKKKLAAGVKLTRADLRQIQADNAMIDAQAFVPYITAALANAKSAGANPALATLGQDPAIAAAVARLGAWDFSTPTGLNAGYDAGKAAGVEPPAAQVSASVAATVYAVWRSQFIANTVDAFLQATKMPQPPDSQALVALRYLLDHFSTGNGVGASGVNFFNVPGVTVAADRRDILILKSVSDGLALLSSDGFAPAFAKSTNLDDYRWGKLHRIVFAHPMGDPFSIPTAGGAFPNPLGAALPGIPRQGGFQVVDASSNPARANTVNGFMFSAGPSRRYIGQATPTGIIGENTLPGGVSGVLGDPNYFSLLPLWLTNQYYSLTVQAGPVIPWQ
jgi:penicillin amidase